MTERAYRFMIGILMLGFLFFQIEYAMFILLLLLSFEGLTNWRVPILISKIRYPDKNIQVSEGENNHYTISYDAERRIRRIVFILVLLGTINYTAEAFWFFPWFVALMLLLAGVTGIYPMVMALRKLGLK